MQNNEVSKVYYARVQGDFRKACQPNCSNDEEEEKKESENATTVTVSLHVYCVSNVEAVWDCAKVEDVPFEYRPQAKHAETLFEFVHYDEAADHSVIKCFPKTGRTHQIRVHLKSLGYPIANDQAYGGSLLNDGLDEQFKEDDFKNSYQNEEATGKKKFVILWLHAFQYTYKDLTVITDVPKWAKTDFVLPEIP